ncbi:MAG TPA: polysaccharide deacetylase family protein [Aggregatilineaceae bacterium]|nr:polysaccharide deacetylase family protein [Aggregatilineaceae bacterium]
MRDIARLLLLVALLGGLAAAPTPTHAASAPFRVYLTFEDGPTTAYTPEILDILASYNAKATFFVNGWQIQGKETVLQRIVHEGHAIGNHLWSEPELYAGAPDDDVRASYFKTEAALRDALGPELPLYDAQVKLFRQPGGSAAPFPATDGVQVITYNWHVQSDDCGWSTDPSSALSLDEQVIENVLDIPIALGETWNVYDHGDGVIIVMHDINRVTARILPVVLDELTRAGATFHALPRPGDALGTMPVVLGVPPTAGSGIPGVTMPAELRDYAYIRTAPDTTSELLVVSLPPQTRLTAIGRQNDWIQVDYNGALGWIYRENIRILGPIPSLPVIS